MDRSPASANYLPRRRRPLNRKYGLDKPVISVDIWNSQYGDYFENLLQGDLGVSFRSANQPVWGLMKDGLWVSLQLGLVAFVFAVTVGLTLGIISALNHNGPGDYLGGFFATIGAAMPNFVLATFLVIIFSVELGWFDVLGWEFGNYKKMVLPVVALGRAAGGILRADHAGQHARGVASGLHPDGEVQGPLRVEGDCAPHH